MRPTAPIGVGTPYSNVIVDHFIPVVVGVGDQQHTFGANGLRQDTRGMIHVSRCQCAGFAQPDGGTDVALLRSNARCT